MAKKGTEIKTSNRKRFLSSSLSGNVSEQQCLLNCSSKGAETMQKLRQSTRASLVSLRLQNWLLPAFQTCTISKGEKKGVKDISPAVFQMTVAQFIPNCNEWNDTV